ncbi:SusC/RagA family TonB-linked outer membrane protein [Rufibacter immobilis]|uniref:SusC/RagA family TonB-linked outer membrane protein n=1 Tax=Rufibacter immobilis TaxID=1348778 RepID=UPI0035E65AE8
MTTLLQQPPIRRNTLRKGLLIGSCLLMMGTTLLPLPAAAAVFFQQTPQTNKVPVKGKIVDKTDGSVMPGVTIFVNGQAMGMSNADGTFQVSAETGSVLSFTFIGYLQQKITITKAEDNLTVTMATDAKQLNEVVVTALGIEREEKALGYSTATVQGDELTNAMSNNWTDALSGRVAGLNMTKSGGGPAGSNKVLLRGQSQLDGGGEALIVVDGVIVSSRITGTGSGSYLSNDSPVDFGNGLSDINPDDIESVSVLKGPGAAALYGNRGANGAIVITTKSGKPTQKGIGVSFNSNTTISPISRWPDYQYEYGQGAAGQDTWYSYNSSVDGASTRSTSSAWGAKFDGQEYFQYDPATNTRGLERTPWLPYKNNRKDFFETAKTFTNSISVEGGTAKTTARLSFTNLTNTWIIPNTGYNRNTVSLSASQKVTDKLQIATKINYTNKYSDNLPSTGYNNQTIMYFMIGMVPNADINWYKNYWVPGKEGVTQISPFSSLVDNPYLMAYEMLNKSNRNELVGNVTATYNFTKDLSLMVRSSMNLSHEARSQQRPKDTEKYKDGMYRTQNIFSQEMNSDFLLRYGRTLTDKFEVNASVGGSRMENKYNRDEVRAEKLMYPGIFTFANSRNLLLTLPYRSGFAVNSLYGLAQFSFNDYLFLDLTGRNDWSSTLAAKTSVKNTSFFYPSVNLSAIISEITNMPSQVSLLKLRGSWAQVGSGGTTPYYTSYGYNSTDFPSGLANPTVIPNQDLQALLTTSVEVGLDLRLFKSRLGIDVTLYNNNTDKQIVQAPLDRSTGYNSIILNSGLVRNKGIEIQANGTPIKNLKGFTWNLFGTFAANRSTIVSLADSINTLVMQTGPRGTMEARPGGRMGDLYGLGYERSPDGQIVYNQLGYPILGETAIYLGNSTPDFTGSLGTELRYKQFKFNVLFDAQYGAVAYSLSESALADGGKLKKTLPGRYNGIIGNGVVKNDDGTYRKNDIIATNIQAYYSEHFKRDNVEGNMHSTDFIKFREARLDYTLPSKYLKKLKLQRATIGVYGRDLFMFTNWPGFDPEFGTLGNGDIERGFEVGQFPSTRSFGLNLSIGI